MPYVIILGVAVALGGWMFYPLLTSSRSNAQSSNPNKKSSRKDQKRSLHSPSSKPPAHPRSQHIAKNSWQAEDDDSVKELERIRRITDIDADIEHEITRIRKLPEFQEQQRSEALPTIQIAFCPQCGTRLEASTLWCTHDDDA